MKNWINKNYKTLIIAAFLIPIITVAIVSISHVTKWYGISNPVTWAVYLSIGVEIAALSALAAISANMGKKVYFPFMIVTIIQFIGNIFFAYSYIDVNGQSFRDWVGLVSPLVEFMGVEPTDFVGHKRFLAFFAGGMLPIISLSFLHMLVKFTEEDRMKGVEDVKEEIDPSEIARVHLSENDLKKLEEVLLNPPSPNETLINAAQKYKELTEEEILKKAEQIKLQRTWDIVTKITQDREEEFGPLNPEDEPVGALANSEYREKLKDAAERYSDEVREKHTHINDFEQTSDKPQLTQEERGEILAEMMRLDQELGLYDEAFNNPMIKEEPKPIDDDISDWDSTLMDGLEEEEFSTIEPTEEEESQNFSTITPESTNIFQDEYVPSLSDEEIMEMNQDEFERKLDMDDFITEAINEFNQSTIEEEGWTEEIQEQYWENESNEHIPPTIEEPQPFDISVEVVKDDEPVYQSDNKEIDDINQIMNDVINAVNIPPIVEEIQVSNEWMEPTTEQIDIPSEVNEEEELKKKVQKS